MGIDVMNGRVRIQPNIPHLQHSRDSVNILSDWVKLEDSLIFLDFVRKLIRGLSVTGIV